MNRIETSFEKRRYLAVGDIVATAVITSFPNTPGKHDLPISVEFRNRSGDVVGKSNVEWVIEL